MRRGVPRLVRLPRRQRRPRRTGAAAPATHAPEPAHRRGRAANHRAGGPVPASGGRELLRGKRHQRPLGAGQAGASGGGRVVRSGEAAAVARVVLLDQVRAAPAPRATTAAGSPSALLPGPVPWLQPHPARASPCWPRARAAAILRGWRRHTHSTGTDLRPGQDGRRRLGRWQRGLSGRATPAVRQWIAAPVLHQGRALYCSVARDAGGLASRPLRGQPHRMNLAAPSVAAGSGSAAPVLRSPRMGASFLATSNAERPIVILRHAVFSDRFAMYQRPPGSGR